MNITAKPVMNPSAIITGIVGHQNCGGRGQEGVSAHVKGNGHYQRGQGYGQRPGGETARERQGAVIR